MEILAVCLRPRRGVLLLFTFAALFICVGPAVAADRAIALKAARLFDGKSKTLMQNAVVVVQGDKIVDLGSNLAVPDGAQLIELGDVTLSPGFMDAHTHLTLDFSGNYNERRLNEIGLNVSEQAIKAVGWARSTVEAGFTTARDLGSPFYFLERQFIFGFAGLLFAWVVTRVPTELWDKYSLALLCVGLLLLFLVLIPGIGATVNGARRWLRVGPVNFQVSELAKVLVLTWVCSYCVRKRAELESTLPGLAKPVGLLTVAAFLLL